MAKISSKIQAFLYMCEFVICVLKSPIFTHWHGYLIAWCRPRCILLVYTMQYKNRGISWCQTCHYKVIICSNICAYVLESSPIIEVSLAFICPAVAGHLQRWDTWTWLMYQEGISHKYFLWDWDPCLMCSEIAMFYIFYTQSQYNTLAKLFVSISAAHQLVLF